MLAGQPNVGGFEDATKLKKSCKFRVLHTPFAFLISVHLQTNLSLERIYTCHSIQVELFEFVAYVYRSQS